MKVAIDARWLQPQPMGGVGRMMHHLLPLLAAEAEITLLLDPRRPKLQAELGTRYLRSVGPSFLWLQTAAPWALRTMGAIFHCPFYGLPYALPVPGIVTLHDLTFEHLDFMPRPQRTVFRAQARHAARSARAIITVSDHVCEDIVATYGVPRERIHVAPPGVDPIFSPDLDRDVIRRRLGLTKPHLVALGGAARRNAALAVAAWQQFKPDVDLVVVGAAPGVKSQAGLKLTGNLDDKDWASLLAGAVAFIWPTAYEGFGMPGLEAMASGTPVICARVGAVPEVLGDAAVWCDDLAVESIAAAIERVIGDERYAERRRSAGLQRAAASSDWTRAAAAHRSAYAAAAEWL